MRSKLALRKWLNDCAAWRRAHPEQCGEDIGRGKQVPPIIDGFRKCIHCGLNQPISEFRVVNRNKSGRASYCRLCKPPTSGSRETREAVAKRWARYSCTDRLKELKRQQRRREYATPKGALNHRMSRSVWQALRRGVGKRGLSWQDLVGYGVDELRAHLEAKFLPGMSWGNFGEWHIDHKRPLASFSYESADDTEFREAWSLSNLQPLWAIDNIRKGACVA